MSASLFVFSYSHPSKQMVALLQSYVPRFFTQHESDLLTRNNQLEAML